MKNLERMLTCFAPIIVRWHPQTPSFLGKIALVTQRRTLQEDSANQLLVHRHSIIAGYSHDALTRQLGKPPEKQKIL